MWNVEENDLIRTSWPKSEIIKAQQMLGFLFCPRKTLNIYACHPKTSSVRLYLFPSCDLSFHFQDPGDDRLEDKSMNGVDSFRYNGDGIGGNDPTSPRRLFRHQSVDNCFPSITSPLSRCGTKRSKTPTRSSVYRSVSREGSTDAMPSPGSMRQQRTNSNPSPPSLSKGRSGRSSISAPIMFSNSSGMLKPAPIEKKLDCTLEELCYGCKRKIKITRDVVTNTGLVPMFLEFLFGLFLSSSIIYGMIRPASSTPPKPYKLNTCIICELGLKGLIRIMADLYNLTSMSRHNSNLTRQHE
jgi:hypothetical protein